MIRYRTEVDNKWVYFKNELYNPVTLYFISGKHKYEFKKINIWGTQLPNLRFSSSRAYATRFNCGRQNEKLDKTWWKRKRFINVYWRFFGKGLKKRNNFKRTTSVMGSSLPNIFKNIYFDFKYCHSNWCLKIFIIRFYIHFIAISLFTFQTCGFK